VDTKHPFEKVVADHGATVLRVCRVLLAGLPYADVAQILGGTTAAARRAAADGIKNLRKSYPGGATS
jgi:hypothetical protein